MLIGKFFAGMAVDRFAHVTFIPSYGAEVRGGTSNCRIILADEEIASPVVEEADAVVVMNQPSADRFLPLLAPGGTAFVNLSMVTPAAAVANTVGMPATAWAQEMGDIRAANMILLGAYLGRRKFFTRDAVLAGIAALFAGKGGGKSAEINSRAFLRGWNHI